MGKVGGGGPGGNAPQLETCALGGGGGGGGVAPLPPASYAYDILLCVPLNYNVIIKNLVEALLRTCENKWTGLSCMAGCILQNYTG